MRTLVLIFFLLSVVAAAQEQIEFKGISFSMANRETKSSDIAPIKAINANWVAVVPYGFIKDRKVIYDSNFQWVGERPEGIRKCIQLAHEQGLKVLMKPHIWIGWGTYTGDFSCDSDEDWKAFEESYHDYIMTFVDIAIEEKVEMFSIGTEWKKAVTKRTEFWKTLIADIRAKYDGKLTYAANWDEFKDCPLWSKLDYIGIDAYFPLSLSANTNLKELCTSWEKVMLKMDGFVKDLGKDVIFTEFGFQSQVGATVKPWESKKDGKFSEKIQDLAFKSFFQTIWKQSWFKGGFVWKWYHDHHKVGGKGDKDFTPQNKLAEETIRVNYGG